MSRPEGHAMHEPPATDPDNIPETLCIGKINIAARRGPLGTLTFTNVRPKAVPMLDSGAIKYETVVRARIVTTLENLVALRDALSGAIQQTPAPAGSGGYELN